MLQFRGMENKLQSFLKEIEENLSWISDTETLLNPQTNPQRDLVEVREIHQIRSYVGSEFSRHFGLL